MNVLEHDPPSISCRMLITLCRAVSFFARLVSTERRWSAGEGGASRLPASILDNHIRRHLCFESEEVGMPEGSGLWTHARAASAVVWLGRGLDVEDLIGVGLKTNERRI